MDKIQPHAIFQQLVSVLFQGHVYLSYEVSSLACKVTSYLVIMAQQLGCYNTCAMTFDRAVAIVRPHKAAALNTTKKAKIILFCMTVFCVAYNIPILFTARLFEGACNFSLLSKSISHLNEVAQPVFCQKLDIVCESRRKIPISSHFRQ